MNAAPSPASKSPGFRRAADGTPTLNVSRTKLAYWHAKTRGRCLDGCAICEYLNGHVPMRAVVEFLEAFHRFNVHAYGERWLAIVVDVNDTVERLGCLYPREADRFYDLISGRRTTWNR